MTDNDSGTRPSVVIERNFDAPVDLVWRLWTDPLHFAGWYGPEGGTVSVAKMDVRVGGQTKIRMTHAGIPAASPGAVGWAMAFDKLAARLADHSDRS